MVILLPDGVELDIPIEYMDVKDGVFIPTLQIAETRLVMRRVAKLVEIQIEARMAVEDGYLGLMVWRTA